MGVRVGRLVRVGVRVGRLVRVGVRVGRLVFVGARVGESVAVGVVVFVGMAVGVAVGSVTRLRKFSPIALTPDGSKEKISVIPRTSARIAAVAQTTSFEGCGMDNFLDGPGIMGGSWRWEAWNFS